MYALSLVTLTEKKISRDNIVAYLFNGSKITHILVLDKVETGIPQVHLPFEKFLMTWNEFHYALYPNVFPNILFPLNQWKGWIETFADIVEMPEIWLAIRSAIQMIIAPESVMNVIVPFQYSIVAPCFEKVEKVVQFRQWLEKFPGFMGDSPIKPIPLNDHELFFPRRHCFIRGLDEKLGTNPIRVDHLDTNDYYFYACESYSEHRHQWTYEGFLNTILVLQLRVIRFGNVILRIDMLDFAGRKIQDLHRFQITDFEEQLLSDISTKEVLQFFAGLNQDEFPVDYLLSIDPYKMDSLVKDYAIKVSEIDRNSSDRDYIEFACFTPETFAKTMTEKASVDSKLEQVLLPDFLAKLSLKDKEKFVRLIEKNQSESESESDSDDE